MNVLVLILFHLLPLSQYPAKYSSHSGEIHIDGLSRNYIVYKSELQPEQKQPVIIVLHGGGGTADKIQKSAFRLERRARREGAIIVYPNAINHSWNVAGLPTYRDEESEADDVAFMDTLIEEAIREWQGDPERVYVTGASRGGQMSFYLAQALNHRIAGIAPMIASIHREMREDFHFPKPVPTLVINGTEDPLIPYGGGVGKFGRRKFRGYGKGVMATEVLMAKIARINGCQTTHNDEIMPDKNKRDDSHPVKFIYDSCPESAPTVLIKVVGGGHTLPGGGQYAPERFVGNLNRDFHAYEEVWDFFMGLKN